MIAEVLPGSFDPVGRKVFRPDTKSSGLKINPTMPVGRYFSHPITMQCHDIAELRAFLKTCEYASDEELFGKKEHWQPPEEFEERRRGDCDDFALWTWRQLLAMGHDARLALGPHGRYMSGHAWVFLYQNGRTYLVEPQNANIGMTFPRLSTIWYRPIFSIGWDGKRPSFYQHDYADLLGKKKRSLESKDVLAALPEWILVYLWYWTTHPGRLFRYLLYPFRALHRTR